jgi:hypothetical protein
MTVESAEIPGRGKDGRYARTEETAERDAYAAHLRSRGKSYPNIAREMGYANAGGAYKAVQRALKAIVAEPAAELRTIELVRLDGMWEAAQAVLEGQHFVVSQGRLIRIGGEPMIDDGPVLAALDRLLKIQERRAKLLGLDAPTKTTVTVTDELDAEIRNLVSQLKPADERRTAAP